MSRIEKEPLEPRPPVFAGIGEHLDPMATRERKNGTQTPRFLIKINAIREYIE
jgi:hypothetical protein